MLCYSVSAIVGVIVGVLVTVVVMPIVERKMGTRSIPLYRYKCRLCDYEYTSPGSGLTKSRAVVHQMDVHDR